MIVAIQPIGPFNSSLLDDAERYIRESLSCEVLRCAAIEIPPDSYDKRRRQYSSTALMLALAEVDRRLLSGGKADRILGLTEADIFIPMLTFVFGQAQFQGRIALVSTARLEQEFYGVESDAELLRLRLRKEIGHELGHSFGLIHCRDQGCMMSLATSIQDVDRKTDDYCHSCRRLAEQYLIQPGEENREIEMADSGS